MGYRGEIKLRFRRISNIYTNTITYYDVGDRVGQIIIIPYPKINFVEVNNLEDSDRGNGGFGSSGK